MKKSILLLLLAFVLSSATLVRNGEKITLASTSDTEYIFASSTEDVQRTAYIYIVSSASGVQVSSGEAIADTGTGEADGHCAWPTGSKIPIRFTRNGSYNLHFKGSVSDVIVVTY